MDKDLGQLDFQSSLMRLFRRNGWGSWQIMLKSHLIKKQCPKSNNRHPKWTFWWQCFPVNESTNHKRQYCFKRDERLNLRDNIISLGTSTQKRNYHLPDTLLNQKPRNISTREYWLFSLTQTENLMSFSSKQIQFLC